MSVEVDTFRAPSFLANALVNGDDSSLETPDDFKSLRWLTEWVRLFYGPRANIVSCEDAGFAHCMSPLIPAPRTLDIRGLWLGGNTEFYTVIY